MSEAPVDAAAYLNEHLDGFNRAMGLTFLTATPDEVVAELVVAPVHHQPYGIVHGGVHCGVIETVCSAGAAVYAIPRGQSVVGLENHTSFIRAVRSGKLTVRARPITRGRRSQVWEATVEDDAGKLAATGRVRLLCLDPDADVGGEKVRAPG
jgi:uncharacterized protein (TIGR00369 family)